MTDGFDVDKTLPLVESEGKFLYVIIPWLEASTEVGAEEVKPAKESELTTEGITFWALVLKMCYMTLKVHKIHLHRG